MQREKPHGKWTAFEQDSVVFWQNNYQYGLKHGKQSYYFSGGKLKKNRRICFGRKEWSFPRVLSKWKFEKNSSV